MERLAQAYLLLGPESHRRAEEMARRLLCQSPGAAACGQCVPCRETAAGSSPDFDLLEPPEPGSEGALSAEEVRDRISSFLMRRASGGRKVLAVVHAERLSPEAKDALLRPFEEPPEGAVLLLAAEAARAIPETLRSRCRTVRLPASTSADLDEFPVWKDLAAAWSRGGSAAEAISLARSVFGGKKEEASSRREKARRFLAGWSAFLRTLLRQREDADLERAWEGAVDALGDLQRMVTPELVLEGYFFSLFAPAGAREESFPLARGEKGF